MVRIITLLICLLLLAFVKAFSVTEHGINQNAEPQTLIKDTFLGDSFSFLIAGDNGGFPEPFYSTQVQRGVAAAMALQSAEYDCKFIMEIGDNFYYRGVKDIFDERWQGTFEEVYFYPSLYIPWYITTGNHDWGGSVQAQIDYSKISSRWRFPWYWYTLEHILEPSGTKMRTIMFETTITCGIGLNSIDGVPIDFAMAEEEWRWFEKELQESQDADYLLVVGHYPIYSAAATGPNIACLKDRMDPLLKAYGVSAYIAGHEHSAQHLVATDGSQVEYIIIGCSNFVNPFFANADSSEFTVEFSWASYSGGVVGCFGRADVTSEHMKISILEAQENKELHTITIPKRVKS